MALHLRLLRRKNNEMAAKFLSGYDAEGDDVIDKKLNFDGPQRS
jgi:hypothetical protein